MGKVIFLGVEGSGKTVLTMGLVNAFKQYEDQGLFLRPDSRESYRFLMQQSAKLERGELPGQTADLKHLAWTVVYNREPVRQMDVLDYPGEIYRLAFLDSDEEPDPAEFRERTESHKEEIDELLGHLSDSDHVFVLFNLADAQNQENNAQNLDAVWVTNACIDYLYRLPSHPKITLLLTQIDRYYDLNSVKIDSKLFYENHISLIHNNFPDLQTLAVSAITNDIGINGMSEVIRALLPSGFFEEEGEGIPENITSIISVARQGNVEALNMLGVRYLTGDGVPVNPREAVRIFKGTAKQGSSDGQYNLGCCYERGLGVTADPNMARSWFQKAAGQGVEEAKMALQRLTPKEEETSDGDYVLVQSQVVNVREDLKSFFTNWKITGRASRSEFWLVFLLDFVLFIVLGIGTEVLGTLGDILFWGYLIVTLVPRFCLMVRRLHDSGRSGWWMSLMGLLFALLFMRSGLGLFKIIWIITLLTVLRLMGAPSQLEDNQYGPCPNMIYMERAKFEADCKQEKEKEEKARKRSRIYIFILIGAILLFIIGIFCAFAF